MAVEVQGRGALTQFLAGLATDPTRLGAFLADPAEAMASAGLSAEDRQALGSGNTQAIFSRLGVDALRVDGMMQASAPEPEPDTTLVPDSEPSEEPTPGTEPAPKPAPKPKPESKPRR
ncbi:hypothetical protein JRI60_50280 [Archangium violaceum]|uniref:hypothetical protein n=1 Tax=Archangium violaceum TaxID=83451 RepID=UPI00194F0D85|nr:hypothetical protein [Archangium violaceum]QRN97058.1 hypothetical protein JRI60_50280 [Archangium violaceum]